MSHELGSVARCRRPGLDFFTAAMSRANVAQLSAQRHLMIGRLVEDARLSSLRVDSPGSCPSPPVEWQGSAAFPPACILDIACGRCWACAARTRIFEMHGVICMGAQLTPGAGEAKQEPELGSDPGNDLDEYLMFGSSTPAGTAPPSPEGHEIYSDNEYLSSRVAPVYGSEESSQRLENLRENWKQVQLRSANCRDARQGALPPAAVPIAAAIPPAIAAGPMAMPVPLGIPAGPAGVNGGGVFPAVVNQSQVVLETVAEFNRQYRSAPANALTAHEFRSMLRVYTRVCRRHLALRRRVAVLPGAFSIRIRRRARQLVPCRIRSKFRAAVFASA